MLNANMNIERKNTLFVVALVLMVLGSVAAVAYSLINSHVRNSMEHDMRRSHQVLREAEKNNFEQLLTTAKAITSEPSLVAATLTMDIPTISGMLEDLYLRPGIDMLAIYLDTGPEGVTGMGRRPHFFSPQVLASPILQELVNSVINGEEFAYGNSLVFDTLLKLVAIPIVNPIGGKIGVLVAGNAFDQASVEYLKQLVRTDVMFYRGNVVLGTTEPTLAKLVTGHEIDRRSTNDLIDISAGGVEYMVQVHRLISSNGNMQEAAKILLARPKNEYWESYASLGRKALYLSMFILLIAAFLGIAISRATLTRPISELLEATRKISRGDLSSRVLLHSKDELGELAGAYNGMMASLLKSRSELEKSRKRFSDFADSSSDWLWETDISGRFIYVSQGVKSSLGMPAENLLGRSLDDLFPESNLDKLMQQLRTGECKPEPFRDLECLVRTCEGKQLTMRLNGIPVYSKNACTGYRGTTRDITRDKQDQQRMMVLANQDYLTGLMNRRRFLKDLEYEVHRADMRGTNGALILIDLDHLKLVNDTAGHSAGDDILVRVAELLRHMFSDQDMVARLSGDEFAVAFSEMDGQLARNKSKEILAQINSLRSNHNGRSINVSASIGIVAFPAQGNNPVELLAKADTAMYAAKDAGRNRAQFYNEEDLSRERMDNQLTWKSRIKHALDQDLFVLVFQPIVAAYGGGVHHYEVLLRMRDQDGSLIPPSQFIPVAERFGLINQVDRVVVVKAIRYLAEIGAGSSIGLAINLSGISVGDDDMLGLIRHEISHSGVSPEQLTFEITESAACEHLNRASQFIQDLRQMGCHAALDDFGVGFSSFAYLKNLHVDSIKIDGSFIREIHESKADQLFVKALINVASGLGMTTTAEFVENQQIFDTVRDLGIDYVQGYHVVRPMGSIDAAVGQEADVLDEALVSG